MSTVSFTIRQRFSTWSGFASREHLMLSEDILIVITGKFGVLLTSGHPAMCRSAP